MQTEKLHSLLLFPHPTLKQGTSYDNHTLKQTASKKTDIITQTTCIYKK